MQVSFHRLFLYALPLEIQLSITVDCDPLNGLASPHFWHVSIQDIAFQQICRGRFFLCSIIV